jgi:cbb3-type cytochrome oxidase subunit 3
LIAAPSVVVEFTLRRHFGYQWALTIFEICVIFCLFLIFGFGPERKGHDFHA